MAKKKSYRRAGEWRFGDEIQPPENPRNDEEAELWRHGSRGELQDARRYLRAIAERLADQDAPEEFKVDLRRNITEAIECFDDLDLPKVLPDVRETAHLAAMLCFSIGREETALQAEAGKNGHRIAMEKKREDGRRRAGESRSKAARNARIRNTVRTKLEDGVSYPKAIQDLADFYGRSETTIRAIAPKNSFS